MGGLYWEASKKQGISAGNGGQVSQKNLRRENNWAEELPIQTHSSGISAFKMILKF